MDKKANALIALFITGTIAVVLIAGLLIPSVREQVYPSRYAEHITKVGNSSVAQNTSLTYDTLLNISIDGLTASNYSYSLSAGWVYFNATSNGTYEAIYYYEGAGYQQTSTGEKALFAVVILAAIIGLIYFLFNGAGIAGRD